MLSSLTERVTFQGAHLFGPYAASPCPMRTVTVDTGCSYLKRSSDGKLVKFWSSIAFGLQETGYRGPVERVLSRQPSLPRLVLETGATNTLLRSEGASGRDRRTGGLGTLCKLPAASVPINQHRANHSESECLLSKLPPRTPTSFLSVLK